MSNETQTSIGNPAQGRPDLGNLGQARVACRFQHLIAFTLDCKFLPVRIVMGQKLVIDSLKPHSQFLQADFERCLAGLDGVLGRLDHDTSPFHRASIATHAASGLDASQRGRFRFSKAAAKISRTGPQGPRM